MMTEVLVGTGGWSYFSDGPRALQNYSHHFRSVEVNSTFYSYPKDSALRRWRGQAPRGFVFTMKAHRDITHNNEFAPSDETYQALSRINRASEILRAEVIVFQCSPTLSLNRRLRDNFKDLFSSIKFNSKLAIELRTSKSGPDCQKFLELIGDLDFIEVVDLSRDVPSIQSEVLYSRLFGRGEHNLYQFDDEEIAKLHTITHSGEWRKSFLIFHTIGMYFDAARMQRYEMDGNFLPVSHVLNADSVVNVLGASAFPAWRGDLIRRHGWKLCDWQAEERIRLSEILDKIPDKLYLGPNELRDAVVRVQL